MALDLNTLPAHYLKTYGRDKVAEIVQKPVGMVTLWEKNGRFTIDALQRLLTFDPGPLGAVTPLYPTPEVGTKLMILVPLSTPPAPKMMDSLIRLLDKREMTYERFSFNCLSVARNVLAARWLRTTIPLAFWMDGDSLLPASDAAWFKEAAELPDMPDIFAGLHSIHRMHVHKKTIVSCCYPARRMGGPVQFHGGDTAEMRAKIRGGPRDELIERQWAGMGGMLTHRSVFDDIVKTQGDSIKMNPDGIGGRFKYTHGFFNPLDGEVPTDDVPFCIRAGRAGHKTYVDLAVQCGHVGDRVYTYKTL